MELDPEAGTVTEVWSYAAPDCLSVPFLGSAERLPTGNTLISWSAAGRIDEVTADGELAWQVGLPLGVGFGFAEHIDSLY